MVNLPQGPQQNHTYMVNV